eukprot:623012-Rhodomonas_salina.1
MTRQSTRETTSANTRVATMLRPTNHTCFATPAHLDGEDLVAVLGGPVLLGRRLDARQNLPAHHTSAPHTRAHVARLHTSALHTIAHDCTLSAAHDCTPVGTGSRV